MFNRANQVVSHWTGLSFPWCSMCQRQRVSEEAIKIHLSQCKTNPGLFGCTNKYTHGPHPMCLSLVPSACSPSAAPFHYVESECFNVVQLQPQWVAVACVCSQGGTACSLATLPLYLTAFSAIELSLFTKLHRQINFRVKYSMPLYD